MPTIPPPKPRAGTNVFLVLIPVVMLFATACGYRGPLYLPDDPQGESQGESSSETVTPDSSDDSEETETDEEEDRDAPG